MQRAGMQLRVGRTATGQQAVPAPVPVPAPARPEPLSCTLRELHWRRARGLPAFQ